MRVVLVRYFAIADVQFDSPIPPIAASWLSQSVCCKKSSGVEDYRPTSLIVSFKLPFLP
jgi:hypothetical protein